MQDYIISPVRTKIDLDDFTMLPFSLYDESSPWVPPLIGGYKKYVSGVDNSLHDVGPNEKIILRQGDKTLGRLLVGINKDLNEYHNLKEAYISQFESVNDPEVARLLLDFASDWAKKQGVNRLKGPLSLPGGDDNRGFIIDNFDSPPYIMNTYNLPYYNDLFTDYGFEKYADCYAFESELIEENLEKYKRIVPLLMKRYQFRLDKINLKDKEKLKKDAEDIRQILEEGMPKSWEDFMPPTKKETDHIINQLAPFADEDFIFIARSTVDERPIGFNITLPDYNQILKKMKGRIFPTGFITFLMNRKKMDRGRMFVLFVVPDYRKKGVTGAIYLTGHLNAIKKGYKKFEGSTVWDYNKEMLLDIEGYGAKKYITYRIYTKNLE